MVIFRRTIVLVQHLVSSLSLGDCSVHRLGEVSYIQLHEQYIQHNWIALFKNMQLFAHVQ